MKWELWNGYEFRDFNTKRCELRVCWNATTSTSAKRTANIVGVALVAVRLWVVWKLGVVFAVIVRIATRHYWQCQNVNAEYDCEKFHLLAKLVISLKLGTCVGKKWLFWFCEALVCVSGKKPNVPLVQWQKNKKMCVGQKLNLWISSLSARFFYPFGLGGIVRYHCCQQKVETDITPITTVLEDVRIE